MPKKTIPKKLIKKIEEYVSVLRADKLPIKKVILYGSYAKGAQHKWSDVDLCIVSPKFKDAWCSTEYLTQKVIFDMKYTIEPIGFTPQDLRNKYDSLINEIKTTGIEISI